MIWAQRFWLKLQTLFHRNRNSQQLDDEIQFHLEQQIAENVASGMSPEDARYAAMRTFGNPTLLKEQARDTWGWIALESIGKDFRYALRSLRGSPLFTLTVVFSLALGIGANTAIFTLLHASLWKPLPVDDARQIFHLMLASSEGDFAGESGYSYPLFQQFSKTADSWGEVFATEVVSPRLVSPRKFGLDRISSERIAGEAVSANFFSVLDVEPVIGRVFELKDDNVLGGKHVAVLSYSFWRRRFQSDPSVLGKTIFYDEIPYSVVGIARPGFTGIEPEVSVDVWIPATAVAADRGWRPDPNLNWLRLLVRLHRGADPAQAQAIFEAAFRAHVADALLPGASPGFKAMLEAQHITVRPAASGLATTGREYEKPLLVLFAVVAAVLLISCANIANLVLARNTARHHEIMVRLALGASRARVASQLFAEYLILSLLGAVVALLLSFWATRLLLSLLPQSPLPLAFNLRPDSVVFCFTAAVAFVTAMLFGLGPALLASREKLEMSLHAGQRVTRSGWSGKFLLAGQIALTLPLLIGAGLFVETLRNLQTSRGFPGHGL